MAYARHADNLIYVNHCPTGYGRLPGRTCSIAQGCPWTMRPMAIATRPWMKKVEMLNVIPRAPADD